jgi:hypothetical protein
MYRDLKNITIIKGDDAFAKKFISDNDSRFGRDKYDYVKLLGFQYLDRHLGIPLEKQFYQIAGVDLVKKWDNFFIERDLERERALSKQVALSGEYIFLHEDIVRSYKIDRKKINKKYRVFTPDKKLTENIFDYCTIIEKAKEIHVIDSSFMFLIDFLKYDNLEQKLYIHRYSRENNEWQLPILKKDWHILTPERNSLEPLKDVLRWFYKSKATILNHSIFKRAIRKIFWKMGWAMAQPKRPDLVAFIRRYVPGKSFATIYSERNDNNKNILLAKEAGATETVIINLDTIKKSVPVDVVFYCGEPPKNTGLLELLKNLYSITNQILIIDTPSVLTASDKKNEQDLTPTDIESILVEAKFETREKYIFPFETCFVCRAVPTQ